MHRVISNVWAGMKKPSGAVNRTVPVAGGRWLRSGLWLCSLLLLIGTLPAGLAWGEADEEDPELSDYPPGLLARYRSTGEQAREVTRVDPDIAFDWGTATPDARLPEGSFAVDWTGYFLMKGPGTYTFHAYLAGEVEVRLDDRVVLQNRSAEPAWVSGKAEAFSFGELPLEVKYRKTGPRGVVKLFWSSPQFALEPISTHLLFREEGDPELALQEQGRLAYRAWRCGQCHDAAESREPLPAPSLRKIQGHLSADWMVQKLITEPEPSARMPHLGLSEQEARDVADYLLSVAEAGPKLSSWKVTKPEEERKAGELLVRTTGCLACHDVGELGETNPFGGGSLTEIGHKRSREWLAFWLKNPAALNPTHRMPIFTLSEKEQRQMAFYLSELGTGSAPGEGTTEKSTNQPEGLARGKALVERLSCAACHEIPGHTPRAEAVALFSTNDANPTLGESGCLADEAPAQTATTSTSDSQPNPHYPQAPRAALRAWLKAWQDLGETAVAGSVGAFQRGHDLLLEKNCLACHARDRHAGIGGLAGRVARVDSRLQGQTQSLLPPHLTAVGDRLQDEALRKALSGDQPKRLSWLAVRMPKFQHSAEELDMLTEYLIGHDRLPDPIPDVRLKLAEVSLETSDALLIGRELTGGRAFNCIACHKMGDYEPRNTAVGTKGSDLLGMAGRLRSAYFLRWTMSPIRVVPGMEMPSFNQPRPGFEIHALDEQLATLWRALNDPTFTAPSNPTVVEQYLVVKPEDSPRVVRDVFEVQAGTQTGREFIARPLAVGLNNGHSLLFDLDQFALRGWGYGDFAYQQTEGKSWFWYLAGAQLASGWEQPSDIQFHFGQQHTPAESTPGRRGRLRAYRPIGDALEWTYTLDVVRPTGKNSAADHTVQVTEVWSPVSQIQGGRSGWLRKITVEDVPSGSQLRLTHQVQQAPLGEPALRVGDSRYPLGAKPVSIPFEQQGATARLEVEYSARLPARSTQPFPPKPEIPDRPEELAGTPGFRARRLPLSSNIMPTAITFAADGTLLFTSLKGDVFAVSGGDASTLPYQSRLLAEGLSAPFGVIEDQGDVVVVHKPEVLRLGSMASAQPAGPRQILADGWGHTDDYHDWVSGFARDEHGHLIVATGSNYSHKNRPRERSQHRGEVIRLQPGGLETLATELRYPTGIAQDATGRIFVSDQQGVQNTFNEINHIVPGRAYGVPPLFAEPQTEQPAAIQIPHPWTRSVNGIFFIPEAQQNLGALQAFAGHGVGCEYNNRFLLRFSLQEVNGELQGACYEFTRSLDTVPPDTPLLLGPMCGAVGPDGHLYIGNIHDSGWLGGQNVGDIVRLEVQERLPNGIRELRARHDGFEVEFLEPVQGSHWEQTGTYELSGYTRVWQGSYATPDSGRYRPAIEQVSLSPDRKQARLIVKDLRPGHVYDLHLQVEGSKGKNQDNTSAPTRPAEFFPVSAYYTMNQIPNASDE